MIERLVVILAGLSAWVERPTLSAMGVKSDPDVAHLRGFFRENGVELKCQGLRDLCMGCRRSFDDLRNQDADEVPGFLTNAGQHIGEQLSAAVPVVTGWSRPLQEDLLKQVLKAGLANCTLGKNVTKVVAKAVHWNALKAGFFEGVRVELPALEDAAAADDWRFGEDAGAVSEEEEPVRKRRKTGDSSQETSGKRKGFWDGGWTRKKRRTEEPKNSSSWLSDRGLDWQMSIWLGAQTLVFRRMGMRAPMFISASAFLVTAGSYVQNLAADAAVRVYAMTGGLVSIALGGAADLDDFIDNVTWLTMVLTLLWLLGQPS